MKNKGKTVEERLTHLEELSKTQVLRSCEELADYGITQSGEFDIDPDGQLIGKPPIRVRCDFNTGETIVRHNSEDIVIVEHGCDKPGCFEHDIQYQAPMEQIQALIQLSDQCEQSIDFRCYLAPLQEGDYQLGWWNDSTGEWSKYESKRFCCVLRLRRNTHW